MTEVDAPSVTSGAQRRAAPVGHVDAVCVLPVKQFSILEASQLHPEEGLQGLLVQPVPASSPAEQLQQQKQFGQTLRSCCTVGDGFVVGISGPSHRWGQLLGYDVMHAIVLESTTEGP